MEISDVRVKLIDEPNDRLKAVCSITLDELFVVRDLKVVEGTSGLFVAMPSRKLTSHCPRCRSKNHLRARFCNECGSKLPPPRMGGEADGRTKLHRDIAHPINTEFRELVQERVITAFHQELELAKQPGYEPRDLESEPEEYAEPQEQMREPEPEPEPEREPDLGPEDEPTEYDALIAGLGRGEGDRPQRRPQPQYAQRTQQSQPPRRSDDRGRRGGERREDRGGSQDRGRGRDRGQGSHPDRPRTARPAPAASEQQRPRTPRPEPRPERRVEPLRPPAPAPPPAPPPPAPVPAPDDTDDMPFGAGL